jgi:hypothetical protein
VDLAILLITFGSIKELTSNYDLDLTGPLKDLRLDPVAPEC